MQLKQFPFLAALALLSFLQLASAGSFLQAIAGRGNSLLPTDTSVPTTRGSAEPAGAKFSGKSTSKALTSTAAKATGTSSSSTTNSKIIPITVGSPTLNKSLVFTPSEVNASPGDILQFQFYEVNHTITQSTFSEPCQPIQDSDPSAAGIHSGFVPVTPNATTIMTFNMPVNDTKPMFIYCAQGPHCQLGMMMSVNASGNKTLAAYKSAAAKAKKNVPASAIRGGAMGSIPAANAVRPPV